jgi:hypothetical protein
MAAAIGSPCPRSSVSPAALFLTVLLAFLAVHAGADAVRAEETSELVACPVLTSADSRLVIQQWAPGGRCDKAVQTRVTDRYLGYTCTEKMVGTVVCRAYMPGLGSHVFDTSKHYRCLEIGTVLTDEGPLIVGLREWAAPWPKQCTFDPGNTIASELDFVNRQICIAGLCIAPRRLSVVGQSRLRKLTELAFRDLGLTFGEDQANAGSVILEALR